MNQELEATKLQIDRLQSHRNDLINAKFLGGGFGLVIFLFVSMGFGFIIMMISAFIKNRDIRNIDAEILFLKSKLPITTSQPKMVEHQTHPHK